jgi:DNA-directed RNA polymerase subunit RPC12/RpoP
MKLVGRWVCSWVCHRCGANNTDSGQYMCINCGAGKG